MYPPDALVVAPVCGDHNYAGKNPECRQQALDKGLEMQRVWLRGVRETQAGAVSKLSYCQEDMSVRPPVSPDTVIT